MSTYWTYECHEHEPPIQADDSINRGEEALLELLEANELGLLPTKRQLDQLRQIEVEVTIWDKSWPWRFLMDHPLCDIWIVSEYGDRCIRDESGNIRRYRKDGSELK